MSNVTIQNSGLPGNSISPVDQVHDPSYGSLINIGALNVFNSSLSAGYNLDGQNKIMKIQPQTQYASVGQGSAETQTIFTISNNLNIVNIIRTACIEYVVTNTNTSAINFTSPIDQVDFYEILINGSTVATVSWANILTQMMYLPIDQLYPLCSIMGINFNPSIGRFNSGVLVGPGSSFTFVVPLWCIIPKLIPALQNEQVSVRLHTRGYNSWVISPSTSALASFTQTLPDNPLQQPLLQPSLSLAALTGADNTHGSFSVTDMNLLISGIQLVGATYLDWYNSHLGKRTLSKILIPRFQTIPLSSPPVAGSQTAITQQLSILSGKFISMEAWIGPTNPNANVTCVLGTGSDVIIDGYSLPNNGSGANATSTVYPNNIIATALTLASVKTSGVFPSYYIPQNKLLAGNMMTNTSLYDSSGNPVFSVVGVDANYQSSFAGAYINRSPLEAILPIVSFEWSHNMFLEVFENTYLSATVGNGLWTLYMTPGANYFYTGLGSGSSAQMNAALPVSLYITALQCALLSLSESGSLSVVYI